MRIYLKRAGKYIGCQPGTTTVYLDRAVGGPWEVVLITPDSTGKCAPVFEAAQLQLTITPEGQAETRPIGHIDVWELDQAVTEPDGQSLLYRFEGADLDPLTFGIEAA